MKEKKIHEMWLERAKSNLQLGKIEKRPRFVFYADLCFQLQQAVEKSLKALLIYRGIEFDYTHDIGMLLNLIEEKLKITIPEEIKEAVIKNKDD